MKTREEVRQDPEVINKKRAFHDLQRQVLDLPAQEQPGMLLMAVRDALDYIENHLEGDFFGITDEIFRNRLTELGLFQNIIQSGLTSITEAKNAVGTVTREDKEEVDATILNYYADAAAERTKTGHIPYSALKNILMKGHDGYIVNRPDYYALRNYHQRKKIKDKRDVQDILQKLAQLKGDDVPLIELAVADLEEYVKQHLLKDDLPVKGLILRARVNEVNRFINEIERIKQLPIDSRKGEVVLYLNDAQKRIQKGILGSELKTLFQRTYKFLNTTEQKLPQTSVLRSYELPSKYLSSESRLGSGNFGDVYRARWKNQTTVAIKKPKNLPGKTEAEIRQELIEEATHIVNLNSPYVVKLYGIYLDKKPYGIVMEYMANGSLFDYLYAGSGKAFISWDKKNTIAYDIAKGIQYMHNLPGNTALLHRDLKSLNVLLDARHRAKISDFGTGKSEAENPQTIVGTKTWMAPEVNGQTYTRRADIYSYSVVIMEIAASGKVWEYPTRFQCPIYQMTNNQKQFLFQGNESQGCPDFLKNLAIRCSAADPNHRLDINEIVSQFENMPNNSLPPPPQPADKLVY